MDKTGPTLAYYVYMLRCSDGSYYVGHTNDLEHRLAAHERVAIEGYTLSRRPVELCSATGSLGGRKPSIEKGRSRDRPGPRRRP